MYFLRLPATLSPSHPTFPSQLPSTALYELVDSVTMQVLDLPVQAADKEPKTTKLMEQLLNSVGNLMGVLVEKVSSSS